MTSWFPWRSQPTPAKDPAAVSPRAVTGRAGVRVSDILSEETILIASSDMDKDLLLKSLVAKACARYGLGDAAPFVAKVLEREQGISTTLDTGLALPHARMDGVPGFVAALAVAPQGIKDPQQPELSIRVMFLFFSPNKQEAFAAHLQLLRGVATLFEPALISEISRLAEPAKILALLRAREAK